MLLRRKLDRAFSKLKQASRPLPTSRTADEWAALSRDAARLAAWRERACLKKLLKGYMWRAADIGHALHELGYLQGQLTGKINPNLSGLLMYPRIRHISDFSSVIGLTCRALSIDE
eukprot:6059128-Pleurochrysis_carterae.AAC.5